MRVQRTAVNMQAVGAPAAKTSGATGTVAAGGSRRVKELALIGTLITAVTGGGVALGLAPHQHLDPAGESGDLGLLAGDHIGQIIDRPHQMGEFFFQMLHRVSFYG